TGEETAHTGEETAHTGEETAHTGEETAHTGEETAHTGEETAHTGEETAHTGEETAHTGEETAHTGEETAHTGEETAHTVILQNPAAGPYIFRVPGRAGRSSRLQWQQHHGQEGLQRILLTASLHGWWEGREGCVPHRQGNSGRPQALCAPLTAQTSPLASSS
uniref:Uncharacterized protein n=1 Tax=Junco hyemalis TaxID=40217 RepID=A0A8C5JMJ5_JUNHY